jgi:putative ABC transport system permease protein
MENRGHKPSRFAWWILEKLSVYSDRYLIKEDLEEEYLNLCQTQGKRRARQWLRRQTLLAVGFYLKYLFSWRTLMLKNYLKITIRNIKRHKAFSFINISGLAISMTCSLFILLYVLYECSYDRYHEKSGKIYRVITKVNVSPPHWGNSTPELVVTKMKEEIPEIDKVTRFYIREEEVNYEENHFVEKNFYYGDPQLFDIFSFPFILGDPITALKDPNSILITQETSKKYFGDENPIGKVLSVGKEDRLFTITGLLKDIPFNSSFRFDLLASVENLDRIWRRWRTWWGANILKTFILLSDNTDPYEIEKKLPIDPTPRNPASFHLQALEDIHFNSKCEWGEFESRGDIKYVYIFSAVALFILLIAAANYMNLTTAKYSLRIGEVGIRKVVGANRKQLICQFFSESLIYSFISLMLSVMLLYLMLPSLNALIDKKIDFSILNQGLWFLLIFGITGMIGLISGSYPAFFLSAFHPSKILKGNLNIRSKGSRLFRNSLVTGQFIISIVLISGLIISFSQLKFMKNKDLGYNKKFTIKIALSDYKPKDGYETLKTELAKLPGVLSVSASSHAPNDIRWEGKPVWEGQSKEEESLRFRRMTVDPDFFNLYGIEFIKGKTPPPDFKNVGYVLNETAAKIIGWEESIGKRFGMWKLNGNVIGVIKDFHFAHLDTKIGPVAIGINDSKNWFFFLSVKIRSNNITGTLDEIKNTWKQFAPAAPFVFSFIDDELDKLYRDDQRLILIFRNFTVIAIFITCLGLFGLSSFVAEQRTKEIGIRKVLGASFPGIFMLLSRGLLKWVLLANIIAWPAAYYFMNRWLQNFAYRIGLSVWIFILSGLAAFSIALLTVSYQSIKAATANPVESLRYE